MSKDPWTHKKNIYTAQQSVPVQAPKKKWRLLPILWLALKRTCMALGAIVLVTMLMISWTLAPVVDEIDVQLPSQMVLTLELEGVLDDLPEEVSFVDPFAKEHKTLRNYINAIERAKTDPRVKGIHARMKSPRYALAHIQELRAALQDFRESGKFAYVFASSYNSGLGSYYLARSFDEVWMQPMGVVTVSGLNAEIPFLRTVLDTVGVEPQMFQRKEYKSAYESFTNKEISEANRESTREMIDDLAGVIQSELETDLGFDIKPLVDQGLFVDVAAKDAGLIDVLGFEHDLLVKMNKMVTGNAEGEGLTYVAFGRYVQDMLTVQAGFANPVFGVTDTVSQPDRSRIALIYAVGAIMDDDVQGNTMNDGTAGAEDIAEALINAGRDESVKAVVLRVNSPGGSPVASETILNAVALLKGKGIPVIVSMGPVAASGGYWISAYADQIFVLPTTITGSIGVLGGKISFAEMWNKIGVNWERIGWGENSAIWSSNSRFSENESKHVNAMLDHIYDRFIERVATGRAMDKDAVDAIAKGRVWTGIRAVELGLADQLGGLNDALDYAAQQVDEKYTRKDLDVVVLPKPLTALEQFIELVEGQVSAGHRLGAYVSYLEPLEPLIQEFMMMHNARDQSVYTPIRVQ